MTNILWKQENNTLAITSIVEGIDVAQHAIELQERGDIPAEWELLATNVQWSDDVRWRHETYRWDGEKVIPDFTAAKDETKTRLRLERAPLLSNLDIQFQRALEDGVSTVDIVTEKNRLRDITKLADDATTLDELYSLHP